jgi:hypothetical protein
MRILLLLFALLAVSSPGQESSLDKRRLDTLLAEARIDQIQCVVGLGGFTNTFRGADCKAVLRRLSATNRVDAPAVNPTNIHPIGVMAFYWETLDFGSSLSCQRDGVLIFGSYRFRLKDDAPRQWFFPYQAYEDSARTKRRRPDQRWPLH